MPIYVYKYICIRGQGGFLQKFNCLICRVCKKKGSAKEVYNRKKGVRGLLNFFEEIYELLKKINETLKSVYR